MNQVNLAAVPWEEHHSPTKKFHSFCRNLSIALGGIRNTGTWGGRHPFDLQIRRLSPGFFKGGDTVNPEFETIGAPTNPVVAERP